MASAEGASSPGPVPRFKRRKTLPVRKPLLQANNDDEDTSAPTASLSPTAPVASPRGSSDPTAIPTLPPQDGAEKGSTEDAGTSLTLKEILRTRKRPRDRHREASLRKATAARSEALELAAAEREAAHQSQFERYKNRFVAQTGQVKDRDDKQMTEYVDARLAEQNYRKYGWPIPVHLRAAVARLAPDLSASEATAMPAATTTTTTTTTTADGDAAAANTTASATAHTTHYDRLAAGMGKLEEVDLGPDTTARNIQRTRKAWRRLDGELVEEDDEQDDDDDDDDDDTSKKKKKQQKKVRLRPDGRPWRQAKRRTSEELRREQMVEAVLKEAKLDYFDPPPNPNNPTNNPTTNTTTSTTNPPNPNNLDNDTLMATRFRAEFLESLEANSRHHHHRHRHPSSSSRSKSTKHSSSLHGASTSTTGKSANGATTAGGVGGGKKISKGPKMGGSRSARARVHALEKEARERERAEKGKR